MLEKDVRSRRILKEMYLYLTESLMIIKYLKFQHFYY